MIIAIDDTLTPIVFKTYKHFWHFVQSNKLIPSDKTIEISRSQAQRLLSNGSSIYLLEDIEDEFIYKVTKI